ncbi:MAG: DUF3025 domain-containing protein [Sandaracinus sp.]
MSAGQPSIESAFFDPYRALLQRIPLSPLPDAARLQAELGALVAPIRFEPQAPKTRPRRRKVTLDGLYEVRIARLGVVPTRTHLHDAMNALVWATFPRSKRLLAQRQCDALVAQIGERPTHLPNARTRERDVLAMIDEGGILSIGERRLVFGHAILEHLAQSDADVRGFPIALDLPPEAPLSAVDEALASWLAGFDPSGARAEAVVVSRRLEAG